MQGIVGLYLGKENLLDHLGIFCHLYGIPLKVFDPGILSIASKWYPDFDLTYSDFAPDDLNPTMHPWILVGTLATIEPLRQAQRQLFGKTSQFAYLPHGISAKSREWSLETMPKIDLFLFPGKALQELLEECNLSSCYSNFLYTGNYREEYYQKHSKLYENLIQKEMPKPSLFESKNPKLFLMPSNSSSKERSFFFDLHLSLLIELQERYSLIVKPHPLLEEERPGFFMQLKEQCLEKGIIFLDKTPPLLPYLNQDSLLITDHSSVVFDGLVKRANIALIQKRPSIDRYDLSDKATKIQRLEDVLLKDFAPFSCAEERDATLEWLYAPLLKKADLKKGLRTCLQPSLEKSDFKEVIP